MAFPQYGAEEYENLPEPTELEISGPYHYPHDVHPCYRIAAKDRIFASIYIIDENEDRARREAELIVDVMRMGRAGLDKLHYGAAVPNGDREAGA